jgi:transcriptional regulator with XRE-family HTH domain
VNFISKQFADELTEKAMRHAYLDAQTRTKLAQQIRALRIQRGWSQAQLGRLLGKPQSNVHRLEDRDVARYTLTTLLELAAAYDCGILVEFVSYEDFLRRTSDLSPRRLQIPSFTATALKPLWRDVPAMTAPLQTQFGIISGASAPLQVAQSQFGLSGAITVTEVTVSSQVIITNVDDSALSFQPQAPDLPAAVTAVNATNQPVSPSLWF